MSGPSDAPTHLAGEPVAFARTVSRETQRRAGILGGRPNVGSGRELRPKVRDWLLDPAQPAIRFLALTQLMDRPMDDPAVLETKAQIPAVGWAAEILANQRPDGRWAADQDLYRPKYLSSNWMLLVLSDLGLTREEPRIARAAENWIRRYAKPDGGFGTESMGTSHLCLVGNTARALLRFGYTEHPRVRSALEWLVAHQAKLGGWSCWGMGRNLDSWEGLSAFAAYPRSKWTTEMQRAVERGAEFFLERELHRQGDPYAPWLRFHYPVHYYYDLLVGLEVLTELGYSGDPRLRVALDHLRTKQRLDGRWNLDAVHPDVEGGVADFHRKYPKQRPTPFALETPGRPSRMITLRALRVLRRVDGAS